MIEQSTPSLDAAFNDLEHVIESDDAAVRGAEGSAGECHAVASVLGVSVGAVLLVGFALAITGMNLLVRRPLVAATRTIARFASGDESARTVASGARELCEMAQRSTTWRIAWLARRPIASPSWAASPTICATRRGH